MQDVLFIYLFFFIFIISFIFVDFSSRSYLLTLIFLVWRRFELWWNLEMLGLFPIISFSVVNLEMQALDEILRGGI